MALGNQRRPLAGVEHRREPEVAHMQHTLIIQQQITRLHIPVQHPVAVRKSQRLGRL